MITILALIFTLSFGTLIWNIVKIKYLYKLSRNPIAYYLVMILTYVLTYFVSNFVALILWSTTVVLFNILLWVVAIAFICFAAYWLYSKITGKPMNWPPKPTTTKSGSVVKEAQIIEVIEKD